MFGIRFMKLFFVVTVTLCMSMYIIPELQRLSRVWRTRSHSRPPHIILIVADDLGWSDVSWHNPLISTPHLHKLAQNGVILNSSYVLPRCSPTRASLLTGYYTHRIGLQYNVIKKGDRWLPLTFDLLPQKLKKYGYATHMVGKWHLGHCSLNHTPTQRGFDSFFGFYSGCESYYTHQAGGLYDLNLNNEIYRDEENQYSTFLFRDRAIQVIRNHDQSKPLFLYLPFQSVHSPLEVPDRYWKLYPGVSETRAKYCGMVTAMDEAVGDVVTALESRGFLDNLLLVFISDNGGYPGMGGHNWPLRGIKNTLWEGGTRSAGFVYSKTLLHKTNYVNNHIINVADWFPTILEAAGALSLSSDLDGVSQWQTITNGENSSRTENVYGIEGRAAVRVNEYKLIKGDPGCKQPSADTPCKPPNNMDNGWTIPDEMKEDSKPAKPVSKEYQLYNLNTDPYEQQDVSSEFPEIVKQLKSRLEFHTQRSVPPMRGVKITAKHQNDMNRHKVVIPGWCDQK